MPTGLIASTTRLLLREMTPADACHAFLLNNDPEVLRHTGDVPFTTEEEAREFLVNYPDYRSHGFGRWALVRREDGAWLGWCGLKRHADGQVDLGYRLLREYWGKGYATEAGAACLERGFDVHDLDQIIGRVAPGNTASIRVLQKLGMRYWMTAPCEHDPAALIYLMAKEEWGRTRPAKWPGQG